MALVLSLPLAGRTLADARGAAAAREWAMTLHALRWRAVTEGRSCGIYFEPHQGGWRWYEVRDGNGNGLRTSEVRGGVDLTLSGPFEMAQRHPGIDLALPSAFRVREIPPSRGWMSGSDPIRFGRSNLVSFAPDGRASSGTFYLTDDRNRLYGVRLYGASARVRVWRWEQEEQRWSQ